MLLSLRSFYKTLYSRVFNRTEHKNHYYDAIVSFLLQLTSKDAIPNDTDEFIIRILMMYPEEAGMKLTGKDLKDLRLSLGFTRAEFALRFGTAWNIVSEYEMGHSEPPEWLVQKIAQSKKLRTYR